LQAVERRGCADPDIGDRSGALDLHADRVLRAAPRLVGRRLPGEMERETLGDCAPAFDRDGDGGRDDRLGGRGSAEKAGEFADHAGPPGGRVATKRVAAPKVSGSTANTWSPAPRSIPANSRGSGKAATDRAR